MQILVEYSGASSAVPLMAWAVSGLMSPSQTVVRPDSSSILLTSYLAKSPSGGLVGAALRWEVGQSPFSAASNAQRGKILHGVHRTAKCSYFHAHPSEMVVLELECTPIVLVGLR